MQNKAYKPLLVFSLLLGLASMLLSARTAISGGVDIALVNYVYKMDISFSEMIPIILGVLGAAAAFLLVIIHFYLLANRKEAPEPKFCRVLLLASCALAILAAIDPARSFIGVVSGYGMDAEIFAYVLLDIIACALLLVGVVVRIFALRMIPKEAK